VADLHGGENDARRDGSSVDEIGERREVH
jgi:hypothetical protein